MPETSERRAASVTREASAIRELGSPPRRGVRCAVCCALSALGVIGTAGWLPKLFFVATMILICGSWRRFKVGEKSTWNRWTIAFFDLPPVTAKYRQFEYIEIVHQEPTGIGEFLLFGPFALVFGWVVNKFAPGAAGSYELWLNTREDERALVWRGSSQEEFEAALEELQLASGMSTQTR